MIRAIIFDIGGVLVMPGTFRFLTGKYAKMMNTDKDRVHKVFKKHWKMWSTGKINEDEFFMDFLQELKAKEDKETIKKTFYSVWEPDNATFEIVQRLRKRYKIFALTNQSRELFGFLREKYGLGKIFDDIFASYDVKFAKPDPRFFEHVLKETGIKPEECVFIDDREENTKVAKKLGMKAIVFKNPEDTEKQLQKLGAIF